MGLLNDAVSSSSSLAKPSHMRESVVSVMALSWVLISGRGRIRKGLEVYNTHTQNKTTSRWTRGFVWTWKTKTTMRLRTYGQQLLKCTSVFYYGWENKVLVERNPLLGIAC